MKNEKEFEKECLRLGVKRWRKAYLISQIIHELNCTYEQAEELYNEKNEEI